jgi:hypothetical protein
MSSAEDRTKQLRLQQLAADINAGHRKILASIRQSVEQAIETGALLIEAKKLMRRGDWWTWVGDNCEFSYRMSQVYSRLAKHQELVRKTPDHTITTALRAIHDVHACPELAMQVGKGWVKPRPWANTKSVALSGTLRVPRHQARPIGDGRRHPASRRRRHRRACHAALRQPYECNTAQAVDSQNQRDMN